MVQIVLCDGRGKEGGNRGTPTELHLAGQLLGQGTKKKGQIRSCADLRGVLLIRAFAQK